MKRLVLLGVMFCFYLISMVQEKGDLIVFIMDKKKRVEGIVNIMLFKIVDGFFVDFFKVVY